MSDIKTRLFDIRKCDVKTPVAPSDTVIVMHVFSKLAAGYDAV